MPPTSKISSSANGKGGSSSGLRAGDGRFASGGKGQGARVVNGGVGGNGKGKGLGKEKASVVQPGRSISSQSGLLFPVSRVRNRLRSHNESKGFRLTQGTPIFLTAVLEYLIAEVLELSGNACHAHQRKRIAPRHLLLAIKNDEELDKLLPQVCFSESGVVPNIHPSLLPKAGQGKKEFKSERSDSN